MDVLDVLLSMEQFLSQIFDLWTGGPRSRGPYNQPQIFSFFLFQASPRYDIWTYDMERIPSIP